MCLYPSFIKNGKYKPTKKNGGIVPPIHDPRILYVPVQCNKCMECKQAKARNWQVRLLEDIKTNTNGKYITLTLSDKNYAELAEYVNTQADKKILQMLDKIPHDILSNYQWNKQDKKLLDKYNSQRHGYALDNMIATKAMRLFNERWRKKYKKAIRHWTVTELGHNGTENIHLHGILWTDEPFEAIAERWHYGYIWPRPDNKYECKKNYVSQQTINYVTKYIMKVDFDHKQYEPIVLTSAGIGGNYTNTWNSKLNRFNGEETLEAYRTKSGHKVAMPIYWRNKIYNEEERESLWINKLNKQIRYINKQKIDVSKTMEQYWKTLESQRAINDALGYGNNKSNYQQKEYEEQLRAIKQETRIQKGKKNKYKIQNTSDGPNPNSSD